MDALSRHQLTGAVSFPVFEPPYAEQEIAAGLDRHFHIAVAPGSEKRAVAALAGARADFDAVNLIWMPDPHLEFVPNDTNWSQQGYLNWIGIQSAWDRTRSTNATKIAFLDSGLRADHADAGGCNNPSPTQCGKQFPGWDWTTTPVGGVSVQAGAMTDSGCGSGHGTLVTSVAAANTNNSKGYAGTGFDSGIIPLKVFGTTCDGIAAWLPRLADGTPDRGGPIRKAVSLGANVINMSYDLGSYDADEQAALQYAWNSGVTPVASAGNQNINLDATPHYPCAAQYVICVGGVQDPSGTRWNESASVASNYAYSSSSIDFTAPAGVRNTDGTYAGICGAGSASKTTYICQRGTSFSAPIVAGVVALMKACGATPQLQYDYLVDTSKGAWQDAALSGKLTSRFGLIDAGGAVGRACGTPAPPACTGATETPTPPDPQHVGTTVTFSSSGVGCTAPQFRFWVWDQSTWTVMRDWGSGSSFIWYTTGWRAKAYEWYIEVSTNAAGGPQANAWQWYGLQDPCGSASLTANPLDPQLRGTAVNVIASSTVCRDPEYTFWVWDQISWTQVQDWSTSPTYSWNTSTYRGTAYYWYVYVRGDNVGGAQVTAAKWYGLQDPCSSQGIGASPASPQPPGTTVTLTGSATGCLVPAFQFWRYDGATWTLLRDWSTTATYNWDTTGLASGSYNLYVYARGDDQGGAVGSTGIWYDLSGISVRSPGFAAATLMPNGQVGLIYHSYDASPGNGTRFTRYTSEGAIGFSTQLSASDAWYPSIATFRSEVVAAYVDTATGKLAMRISSNSGASWATEITPFGAETFNWDHNAPRVVASRDQQTLYVFTWTGGVPQYRSSTDPNLTTWTAAANAGDGTMRIPSPNNCGQAGSECYLAHNFEFMETATPGSWIYITKSDAGWGQSGRGTQVGTLGGSWSAQVDHGGSGGLSGGGESTPSTFLDRAGNVYYIRAGGYGEYVYYKKSTDGGSTWGPVVTAYSPNVSNGTTSAPIGLYVAGYSRGEYVWWASSFNGASENAMRVIPLWTTGKPYSQTSTVRLFGSNGSDIDPGTAFPENNGELERSIAAGSYTTGAVDLALPGRLLPFTFARTYNSADPTAGALGPAWSHSFEISLIENGDLVIVHRGSGRQDKFTRTPTGTYTKPLGVFDTLVKNADASFTLTTRTQVQYEFTSAGRLTRIHEPAGNQIALTYTGALLSSITDTTGRNIALGYDTSNRLSYIQDPLGRKVTYAYDASGRLATVVDKIGNATGQDPNLHKVQYGYDGVTRHLTTITDQDGRVVLTNAYDTYGRLLTQKDGLNHTTTYSFAGNQIYVLDPRGHQTTITYDVRNRPTQVSDTLNTSTYTLQFGYDACGNTSYQVDRRGSRTDFTFDAGCNGDLLTRQDPQIDPQTPRYTTTYEYDAKNNLKKVTDARAFVTTYTYDAATNARLSVTAQIDATTNATTKYEYTDATNPGLPTFITSPRGNTGPSPDHAFAQTLTYDTRGNLASSRDADGNLTTYSYDLAGRRTTMVDPDGNATGGVPGEHSWTTAYDENDRVTTETDPLGHSTVYGYDRAGNRTSVTDRNGNMTSYAYDGASRLQRTDQKPDPVGQPTLIYSTTVDRDLNGNATKVTQANGVATDYGYDGLNRLTSVTTHPTATTSLTTSYVLDGNGNRVSRTTGDNVTTTYTYDALSRLKTVAATGLSTITYGYDENSNGTSMTDGTGTSSYTYDGLGRMTQAAQPNGTTSYGYNLDSSRISLTYPGANTVTYAFSNAGRLQSVTDWASRTTTYTYKPSGIAATVTMPASLGGLVTTYGYDRVQRLTDLINAIGTTTVSSHGYTLDNEGDRTSLDEFVSGITTPSSSDHFGLGYDGLLRLKSIDTTNPETFALDGASNISSRTGPSATYSYDTSNRLTSDGTQTFTWNNADRLTNRGNDTFGYDALDRLTSSTVSGTSRTYAYNGDGLLQSRSQGTTTAFLWDPATSPSRLLMQGNDKIVYGLGPLYVVKADGSTTAFARDGGKSIRAEVLSSGTVTASFRYRAYGSIVQSSGTTAPGYLGYAGQLTDPSGLLYMRARWYDSTTGRFISRDPLEGSSAEPATLNAFSYARSNPITWSDPSGRAATTGDIAGACVDLNCTKVVPYNQTTVIAQTPLAASTADCRGATGQCTYEIEGIQVISNAQGPLGFAVTVIGGCCHPQNTVTFGSQLIVSTGDIPHGSALLAHELGHVNQARQLGIWYLPAYVASIPFAIWDARGLDFHDLHFAEQNANQKAGLQSDGNPPSGWQYPWRIGR